MSSDEAWKRPVGWWLKEADARLDAAFETCLSTRGADRRSWQVLATLARSPALRKDLIASLASFDEPAVIADVVDALERRGWVDLSDGTLRLTQAGAAEQAALAPLVQRVRDQVATALPEDDYAKLVRLLARLVDGLPAPAR